MDENHNEQQLVKTCPFLNGDCIQDKCSLWAQIHVGVPGPLGSIAGKVMGACSFPALLMVMSSPRPQQQQGIRLPNIKQG